MAGNLFANVPRFAALASLLITLAGFVVIVAGLAKLQQATNRAGTLDSATTEVYTQTFQSLLITPYPTDHKFQFSFIWFIIFGQLFTLLLTVAVLLVPAFHLGRGAVLTFLAIFATLTINVVNNLTFLHKNADSVSTFYSKRDINVTFAGALLVVLGNVFTILALGFWEPWRALIGHNNTYYGTNKTVAQPATGVATAETRV